MFWRLPITRCFILSDRAGLITEHSINFRLNYENCNCRRASCVMCRQQFASYMYDIFETTRFRALIFGIKHSLVGLYQVCSNSDSGVRNGSSTGEGVWGFKIEYT